MKTSFESQGKQSNKFLDMKNMLSIYTTDKTNPIKKVFFPKWLLYFSQVTGTKAKWGTKPSD